ncbi:MAG: 1-deoxy-D-xylulose-5-phosphate reductoisomerase, partial [Planctomycetota bacterium]
MPKRVIILGSTGSIGCNALAVAENLPAEFEIVGLAAGTNWRKMSEQVRRWKPKVAVLTSAESAEALDHAIGGEATAVWSGAESLVRLINEVGCDFVLASIVGAAGLPATLAAVQRGLTVGLANKESLVVAGELMVGAAAA